MGDAEGAQGQGNGGKKQLWWEKHASKLILIPAGVLLTYSIALVSLFEHGVAQGERGLKACEARETRLQGDLNAALDKVGKLQGELEMLHKEAAGARQPVGFAFIKQGESASAFGGDLRVTVLSMQLQEAAGYWFIGGNLTAGGETVPFTGKKVGSQLSLGPYEVTIESVFATTPPGASFAFVKKESRAP